MPPSRADLPTLLLIDANSLIHRAFHALPPLTTPRGEPIQAIYGLASIILKLWREGKPEYAAALFDRPEPTFRKEAYAAYKAQRPAAPNELISQLIEAHRFFKACGIPAYEAPGFEADDLIATLAVRFGGKGARAVILTGDLDTLQLVRDGEIVVESLKKGVSETFLYGETEVRARYGLAPGQLIDYKALVGDPSDNVRGIPGVGPKTAQALLAEFGTVEAAYRNLGNDPKREKKLGPFKKEVELSKFLVTLRHDAPLPVGDLAALAVGDLPASLEEYFKTQGFETLAKRLKGGGATAPAARPERAEAFRPVQGVSVPVAPGAFVRVSPDMPPAAAGSMKPKVGFGLKTTLKARWEKELDLAPPYFDLGVGWWLLDPDRGSYAPEEFGALLGRSWGGSEEDCAAAYGIVKQELETRGVARVFEEIEMPLLPVLARMERAGIRVSAEKLGALERNVDRELAELTDAIYRDAGEAFNLNSPREVGRVLFAKLGLGADGGRRKRSTRAERLEELAGTHPIVPRILAYREAYKLKSTYLGPLRRLRGNDGRVHTDYVQTGTATGRLSSQAPNLQNIPKGTAQSAELRGAFEAAEGCTLVAFDYTQLELRILASLAGDEALLAACREGADLHTLTASRVFRIPQSQVGERERRLAKTLNFGLMYGMGARAFAAASGATAAEAKSFITAYFREFRRVKEWQEEARRSAREKGYVETATGRRRYLPAAKAAAPYLRAQAERAAVNHPVQGLEADIMKMAMARADSILASRRSAAHMLLTIHDELLFEMRDDMMEALIPLLRGAMEQAYALAAPLTVKVAAGKDWGNVRPM